MGVGGDGGEVGEKSEMMKLEETGERASELFFRSPFRNILACARALSKDERINNTYCMKATLLSRGQAAERELSRWNFANGGGE